MNLSYCSNCMRVFKEGNCPYCQGKALDIKKGAPVNIIGTKIKGRILSEKNGKVLIIFTSEDKQKLVKEYNTENLRKIK